MEITDVMQGHLIPIDGGPWRTGVVVDSIPLVGGLFQSEPTNAKKEPEQDRKEQTAEAATRPDQHALHGPSEGLTRMKVAPNQALGVV